MKNGRSRSKHFYHNNKQSDYKDLYLLISSLILGIVGIGKNWLALNKYNVSRFGIYADL